VDKAKELEQKAICFSEHGNIYNHIEKKMYCNENNIKYIHGVEIYLTESLDTKIRDNFHTILISKNFDGVRELNKLIDLSTQEDHFYYKNRISFDEFLNTSDNLIRISACLASPLNRLSEDNSYYEKLLQKYDYYEIQPHVYSKDQKTYNKKLYTLSLKYSKKLICGTDTHSLNSYKAECRSILQKSKKIEYSDEDKFDLTYKDYSEIVEMFRQQDALPEHVYLEAINNTNVMAESVDEYELDFSFKYPKLYDNEEKVFKKLINTKFKEKLNSGIIAKDPTYKNNILEEFRVFKKINMIGFMLFMSEMATWCKENNIPFGNCRGSVGGSTIAFILDIIDLDPVKWKTVFSRFANEDRIEIGDIDMDFSPSQRELVYNYIINRFGIDYTAYILAIGTMVDKGTIDAIGRALNYPIPYVTQIKEAYEKNPEEAKLKYPDLFYYFDGLLNTAVSQSIHPAGMIASPVSLPDNYGTIWKDGKRILCINMEEVHEVSLVKYDILGLKNIEIIKNTCDTIGIPYPMSHEINWEDQNVWNDIIKSPVGIFQFEGKYAFDLLKKYIPTKINDLSLVNASLRPSGASYRDRLIAREFNNNPSQLIDDLLKDNNGFLVFQEDVIAFLQQICGLSGSEADNVRRAIGRKQKDRIDKALPQILEGYCNKSNKSRSESEKEAKEFLDIIESASSYMFGFNHSTGYSMIGYLCGYFRYYYPGEFITSYLNNANNEDDIRNGTELAKLKGIPIESIKFRKSIATYTYDKQSKTIYKGIESIKFCNADIAKKLYELKDNKYNDFPSVLPDIKSTGINSKQLDILIKLNFFKEFGNNKKLLRYVELYDVLGSAKQLSKDKALKFNIDQEILTNYSRQTEKKYIITDNQTVLNELWITIPNDSMTTKEQIQTEVEFLGYPMTIDQNISKEYAFITDINTKYSYIPTLYYINNGTIESYKTDMKSYKRNPFEKFDIICITGLTERFKKKYIGKNSKGKAMYETTEEKEIVLSSWLKEEL
jgi:DNA polymerase-3 subunit alpha